MDRLLTMDREQFIARMESEVRRTLEQIATAVNEAPTGNVISGSEMRVRDLMAELRRKAFQTAVQMRIDSTESSFSPSEGYSGQALIFSGRPGLRPAIHCGCLLSRLPMATSPDPPCIIWRARRSPIPRGARRGSDCPWT
jgi:hypothetical protein